MTSSSSSTLPAGRPPRLKAPPGACDCHFHVYGPADRFPVPGKATAPDAPLEAYLDLRRRLGLSRGVFVQPSAYGTDNACVLDAIARTAPGARGIAVIDPEAPEAELARLHAGGIRGVRFHDMMPGCVQLTALEPLAGRLAGLGWHVQVQLEGDRLVDLAPRLSPLPVDVVIDHMGRIPVDGGTDHAAFQSLLRLLDTGRCWVKLSAPYHVSRSGPPRYADCAARARALVRAAPERMLWGSNWPHPTARQRPDDADLLDVLLDWTDGETAIRRILVDNPAALFGF